MTKPVNTFHEVLDGLDAGGVTVELNRALGEILRRSHEIAEETGATAKGQLTVTLDFATEGRSKRTEITAKVTAKGASRPFTAGVYFATEHGELADRDPRQPDLFDNDRKRKENVQ